VLESALHAGNFAPPEITPVAFALNPL
jgi:hypothetical protein